MKLLLDECLPRKLKTSFGQHHCATVPEARLSGKKNGEPLTLAEAQGYEVFITVDRGIEYTQNLTGRKIAIVVLRARSNRRFDLLPLMEACLEQIELLEPGQIVRVGD